MSHIKSSQLLQQMQWRYAAKYFDRTKKISKEDWSALEQSLIMTPSSYGLQPWKFIVITDEGTRKKLTPLSWNQKQVESCSHYIVIAGLNAINAEYVQEHINAMVAIRSVPPESLESFKNMLIKNVVEGPVGKRVTEWAARQCYIALGNFMTSAAVMGIDTCPMEGFEPAGYDKVLELVGTNYATIVACATGYRSSEDKYQHAKKVRFAAEKVVKHI